jgi:malonyl-CoA/methylmalonyl-CoA synthetase
MVVGVADDEFGQRVAAVVTLREDQALYSCLESELKLSAIKGEGRKRLRLEDLRKDLRDRLAGYKLPTVLRVMDGELPKGATGKVQKKILGPRFFPKGWEQDDEVQLWKKDKEGEGVESEKERLRARMRERARL